MSTIHVIYTTEYKLKSEGKEMSGRKQRTESSSKQDDYHTTSWTTKIMKNDIMAYWNAYSEVEMKTV